MAAAHLDRRVLCLPLAGVLGQREWDLSGTLLLLIPFNPVFVRTPWAAVVAKVSGQGRPSLYPGAGCSPVWASVPRLSNNNDDGDDVGTFGGVIPGLPRWC